LSPSSSNSERTLFKACLVLTFSGTTSSSIFFFTTFAGFGASISFLTARAGLASVAAGLVASTVVDFAASTATGCVFLGVSAFWAT
tara:strand:- start:1447 stop:1704 length:258 start_codon:yes stop_codon:yes gene_type:complete